MLSMEYQTQLTSEQGALQYIEANEKELYEELEEQEIKTIYDNGNVKINVRKDGKRLIKVIHRFEGDKKLLDVYKEMVNLKLF